MRKAAETQQMVTDRPEDLDVVGMAEDELEAAVQVFHVRRGRVVGRNGFMADKVEDLSGPNSWAGSSSSSTGRPGAEVPRRILVPEEPADAEVVTAWLAGLRDGPVTVAVPRRGAKRDLHETVTRNAAEDLTRHRLRRAADHNSRSRALTELQEALALTQAPLRIECYDMSHLQGTDYVGSMVVFEDGLAKKSDYRQFTVKRVAGNDDYAAMEEVLTRRLTALVAEREELAARRAARDAGAPDPGDDEDPAPRGGPRRFAYPPQLLLLDGGKGQLSVGERVVERLGLTGEIDLAALAKQFEEVYRPGRDEPVRMARGSEALYLLQRVRDEAHRFAIAFHRQRRGSRMTASAFDEVPGLGPTRRRRLLKELGGVRAVRSASLEDLQGLSWLPGPVAVALYDRLHGGGGPGPPARSGATEKEPLVPRLERAGGPDW